MTGELNIPARGARIRLTRVHLSSAAPGCADLPIGHPKRWREFWGAADDVVIRAVLTRIGREPADVYVRRPDQDPPLIDVDLMGQVDGAEVVIASVAEGIAGDAVTAILNDLAACGWRPASLTQRAA